MSRVALVGRGATLSSLAAQLPRVDPSIEVVTLAPGETLDDAEIALCWYPPPGSFARLPRLRLVHSIAAGCDHLFADPSLPAQVPICRMVDPDQRLGMTEFVLWAVLHYHRRLDQVFADRARHRWHWPVQREASGCRVGVMGLGALGAHAAQALAAQGFSVRGWARSAKRLDGVACFAGEEAFDAFLDGLDILVCLLPLTEATRGILGRATFARLARDAAVINLGRGEHLVRDDLRAALDQGQLRGALLDVFEREPLPEDDPLWRDHRVIITPHMASASSLDTIAAQVVANIHRLERGEALLNRIDPSRGY
ncbi:2-hydroxyacid dehydrogenase [Halotalea alkalilenta]|uniref:2-hydroxyacid dehydrogenase n=1 Tax=Halotalea alkalilenta TaxID=376489 RepID=UPI0004845394|nr:glyoxylate/hydroxypyruvate reductase A [Halotalea alkalilenta]